MRKNQINFLLIVFFVAVTASCKKDTIIVDNIRDEVNPVLALSKNWYSEETAKIKNQQNDINPILGISH